MSKKNVLTQETAEVEVTKLLKQHDYVLLDKSNPDTLKKVKSRHSRSIQLLIGCGEMWVKLGTPTFL